MATNFRSNADHTRLISKSIFVTNFPDNTSSKDLWKLCQDYGTVVDVYIPNRKSKAGKRFAFVRFIKVENIDRLIGNLCTLWIGRMHLHANVVRFERSPIQASRSASSARPNHTGASSFAIVLKGKNTPVNASEAPAMVIDDSCVVTQCESGVFRRVCGVMSRLEHNYRIYCPLEESKDDLFARKRICIKTKQEDNILEKFKIIVKGTNEDKGEVSNKVQPNPESDDEGVSDTYFGESNEHNSEQPMNDKEKSQDPFNFFDLLRKRDGGVDTLGSNISIPYPPGFTPEKLNNNADVNEEEG
ncbi:RNA-directed DNA polymerase, eukaryota [Tanacetum coccineum]|uniref:RNA-directed DNA polymerase, eukaryota n=1 Tax=Tanacetum coccineum TaxID=301880 RepID=A0ABQ5BN66_9ASTR